MNSALGKALLNQQMLWGEVVHLVRPVQATPPSPPAPGEGQMSSLRANSPTCLGEV